MSTEFKSYREISKTNWGTDDNKIDREQIKLGAIQRIADASEKMPSNFTALQEDRDRYKRWYEEGSKAVTKLRNQIRGLRGAIKRMKRKGTNV